MSDETTPEPQRAAFEAWLMAEHLLDATWNAERNCYDEFPAHLAWKAWRAAWCCQQARSGAMELASKANELREAVQAGASTSDALQVLLDVQASDRDRLLSALRKLANEPQDITSKSYQHALGVLGEFEGNPPAKRRSASA
jgi:hypothetical protein